jgi:hypothetical protein
LWWHLSVLLLVLPKGDRLQQSVQLLFDLIWATVMLERSHQKAQLQSD